MEKWDAAPTGFSAKLHAVIQIRLPIHQVYGSLHENLACIFLPCPSGLRALAFAQLAGFLGCGAEQDAV